MKHFTHYISLIGILIAAFIGFYYFSYDKPFLVAISFALSVSYVVWGIIHHFVHKDISLTVVLEYVTVAILGFVLTVSLIFRT